MTTMNPTTTTTTPRATGEDARPVPGPYTYTRNGKQFRINSPHGSIALTEVNAGPDHMFYPADVNAREATAAFIVRACNSHAALVEALERTAKHLQFLADNIIDDETAAYAACIEVCRQARAAIAKATEGRQ